MNNAEFTLLYDGGCPLCKREADLLRRLDAGRGRLQLRDIAADNFNPADYGRTQDQLMAEIHGVTSDGSVVKGMEVFRRAYASVGFGWLLAPTGWPIIGRIADSAYRWFARHRLGLTSMFRAKSDRKSNCPRSLGRCV